MFGAAHLLVTFLLYFPAYFVMILTIYMRILLAFTLLVCAAAAEPARRHLFQSREPLTEADSRPARSIADDFMRRNAIESGLSFSDLPGIYVAKEYTTAHNGVTHILYRQRFSGLDVINAAWTVNVDKEGRVLNAGGSLAGAPATAPPDWSTADGALRSAAEVVNPKIAGSLQGGQATLKNGRRGMRYSSPEATGSIEGRPVWYNADGVLSPAWMFNITEEDGITRWATIVDSRTQSLLAKLPLTLFQGPRGLVFPGRSPQRWTPGVQSPEAPPYVERVLVPFIGDPIASPRGWFTGTSTAGNNVIAGANPNGITFLHTPVTVNSPTLDFQFPLELGPNAPAPTAFRDAAVTNLFYWANRVHDLFYDIGFDEAAGNYQADNFGRGGVGGDPIYIYAQFGSASTNGFAQLNNAFYQSTAYGEDGADSMVAMFLGSSAGRWADGAYSTETIIHEYTHGVTTRLIPDLITTHQGGALSEAFSDFWAFEFMTPEGAPVDGVYPYGEYVYNRWGVGIRGRPYSTNMEINPLTYRDLGRVIAFPAIHDDGGIWVVSLWEIRANLIRQFGETEGRRRLRRIVLDGMKMSPPSPSMIDVRDAVLLADRVNFKGESQKQIWEGFAKRGLGVLAQSSSGNTILVKASYETPKDAGVLGFGADSYTQGETVRVVLHDANNTAPKVSVQLTASSGDLETVTLQRDSALYTGIVPTTPSFAGARGDRGLSLIAGDSISAYYVDAATGSGAKLMEATVPTRVSYTSILGLPRAPQAGGDERSLLRSAPGNAFARYELPWDFPFFERRFREARVFSNGLISFDTALLSNCQDTGSLARYNAIAPMWMRLRTNGVAQPNEGVYVSRPTPDAVMFRWAGETDPIVIPGFGMPEPVNFSATLYEDGRIEYRYGSGNNNLISTVASLTGCAATGPVVGISKGNGSYMQLATLHNGNAKLQDMLTLTWSPPFNNSSVPVMRLESPEDGGVYRGVLRGRGIAHDPDAFVTNVYVLVDGIYRVRAATGQPRPDVCGSERLPGCPNVGVSFAVNFAALGIAPGSHTLQLRAVNSRGALVDFPEQPLRFTVEAGQDNEPRGTITAPVDGATIRGTTQVTGVAYGTGGVRVQFVDVMIDGIVYGRATYGMARADMCAAEAQGSPNCPGVGFTFGLNSTAAAPTLNNGSHRLQIRVIDESGRATLIPEQPINITVENTANALPTGGLESPRNGERVSGVIRIAGRASDSDGRVTAAALLIDNELRGALRLVDGGFEGEFDTRLLQNGQHTLGVRLLDDRGGAEVIPKIAGGGLNIRVEN